MRGGALQEGTYVHPKEEQVCRGVEGWEAGRVAGQRTRWRPEGSREGTGQTATVQDQRSQEKRTGRGT